MLRFSETGQESKQRCFGEEELNIAAFMAGHENPNDANATQILREEETGQDLSPWVSIPVITSCT